MYADAELISFDDRIESILNSRTYTWQEFNSLWSTFMYAKAICPNDEFDEFRHKWFPNEVIDKFKGYKTLSFHHDCRADNIGCILTKKNQGLTKDEIHTSGLICDYNYFFIMDYKFRFLGINKYEFEIGELNRTIKAAIILAKVKFHGPEGSHNFKRTYLSLFENGVWNDINSH